MFVAAYFFGPLKQTYALYLREEGKAGTEPVNDHNITCGRTSYEKPRDLVRNASRNGGKCLQQGCKPASAEGIHGGPGQGVKLEMVLIPAGEFLMGSPDSDKDARDDEKPQHRVRITKPFYLGKYPVTQEQWEAVTGYNPSYFNGPKNPVDQISWDDCQQFLEKLNSKIGTQSGKIVLPTEAQWEYACRGRDHNTLLLR